MPQFFMKSHKVQASQVTGLEPLVVAGQMKAPSVGLTLILANGARHIWLTEKTGPMPSVGDYAVRDEALNLEFVVPASRFAELFKEAR
jgi:hypothetical protein